LNKFSAAFLFHAQIGGGNLLIIKVTIMIKGLFENASFKKRLAYAIALPFVTVALVVISLRFAGVFVLFAAAAMLFSFIVYKLVVGGKSEQKASGEQDA
jgi:hypothetical protein